MSQPYWDYRDKVDYDYVFKVTLPISYESDDKIHEEQKSAVSENIEKAFEEDSVILSDDYMKEYFPELAVGAVYGGVNSVYDDIEMYFGISLSNAEKSVTIKDLQDNIKEYMNNLNSNLEYDSNSGYIIIPGTSSEDVDDSTELEPININFKPQLDKIEIEVLKQPIKESNFENIDKVLVSEGKLVFENADNIKSLILSDDGMIELYENEKLTSSNPFSKLALIRECKSIIQEGYNLLQEDNIQSSNGITVDTEQSKSELEQGIKYVDELQDLKDELINKVDKLVNESVETQSYIDLDKKLDELIKSDATDEEFNDFLEQAAYNELITSDEYTKLLYKAQDTRKIECNTNNNKFPSTEQTQKEYSANDLSDISLCKDILNECQVDYINNNICDINDFEEGFKQLWVLIPVNDSEPLISIDKYINYLQGEEDIYNYE